MKLFIALLSLASLLFPGCSWLFADEKIRNSTPESRRHRTRLDAPRSLKKRSTRPEEVARQGRFSHYGESQNSGGRR